MWRSIACQAAYQIVVILILQYFGTFIFFDTPYNLLADPAQEL